MLFGFPSLFLDFLSTKDYQNSNIDFISRLNDRESILKSDSWRSFIFIFLSGTLWLFLKGNLKRRFVIIIVGILIISDMWSVDKRYLNETHL